ncbi:MAG TPA: hypothetical protein VK196_21415 [Magnetospirillum sp.]|nr:hypothetical protein [Magnetospirillum sp.]
MGARVEDFLTGLLDGCTQLMDRWKQRHRPGQDWQLARLTCWDGLARVLPADLTGPNGPALDLDPAAYRLMWSESRALHVLEHVEPVKPIGMPALIERLYAVVASRFDPPTPFADDAARATVVAWSARHTTPAGLPQSAMALVDFVQSAPLQARDAQMAALLSSVLPAWAGLPMVHVLPPDGRAEEGFAHALAAACDGEDGAWIAYYLGRARRVLKRMPTLLDGSDTIRTRWASLFRRAPFDRATAEHLASILVSLPVITPTFMADTHVPGDVLSDALVLLFAADEAVEVDLPGGNSVTILPAPLRLLSA